MLIIVDYNNLNFKEEAQRLINKLSENEKNVFIDLSEKIVIESTSVPSLEFAMLKNLFDTEIPALKKKNAIIDGNILYTIMDNFDDFQRDFLFRQMNVLGKVTAQLVENPEEDGDPFSFSHFVGKEFYVDFEKKLDQITKKIEESPFHMLIQEIDAYGYCLGTCGFDETPTKIVSLPGGAGQKISYDECLNWLLSKTSVREIEEKHIKRLENNEDDRYVFVRLHHPIEFILKKFLKKNNDDPKTKRS